MLFQGNAFSKGTDKPNFSFVVREASLVDIKIFLNRAPLGLELSFILPVIFLGFCYSYGGTLTAGVTNCGYVFANYRLVRADNVD